MLVSFLQASSSSFLVMKYKSLVACKELLLVEFLKELLKTYLIYFFASESSVYW